MQKFINKLAVLLLGSMVFGMSGFAEITPPYGAFDFIIKVKTDNAGSSNDRQFTISVNPSIDGYSYNVDCNSNQTNEAENVDTNYTCNYDSAGEYNIVISGNFPAIYNGSYSESGYDNKKIIEVVHWGTGKWKSMGNAFYGASNLTVTATDNPDLSEVTNMQSMFRFATNLTFIHPINDWSVSNVEDMSGMFSYASAFNQDIGDWNVSNVTNMSEMFRGASSFNQDIGNWDVSNALYMSGVFHGASAFNQDIGDWDVSRALYLSYMFRNASAFNQDIGGWNVSRALYFSLMFENAHPISISNYDNLLYSWEKLNLQSNVDFHAGINSHYCNQSIAKEYIEEDYNWNIIDGGENCDFYITTPSRVTIKSGETYVIDVDTNKDTDPYDPIGHHFIVGGADKDKFMMNEYGQLSFKTAPNAYNPQDANGDNIYRVQVNALGEESDTIDYQTIKVTVEPDSNGAVVPIISYLLF